MSCNDYHVPKDPFCEGWTFRVKLREDNNSQKAPNNIKLHAYKAIERELDLYVKESASTRSPLQIQIEDCIESAFPGPDFRYYITEYHEKSGSWEICFAVIAIFYGGVCGYGSFRQGLDTAKNDIKTVFGAVEGLKAKVDCDFKERVVLSRKKIDPIINDKYFEEN